MRIIPLTGHIKSAEPSRLDTPRKPSSLASHVERALESGVVDTTQLTDLHQTVHSLENADFAKQNKQLASSFITIGSVNVDFTKEEFIEPLQLFEKAGIDIDDHIEEVAHKLVTAELALKSFEGIITGASLLFRRQFLSDAEQLHQLLDEKIKDEKDLPEEVQKSLAALKKKIIEEKVKLAEDAKKFGMSTGSYLPSAASTILAIADKSTRVSGVVLGWTGGVVSTLVAGYELKKAGEERALHTKFRDNIENLAKNRQLPANPAQVLEEREKLKGQLKTMTLEKHQSIDKYLQFSLIHRKAKFFVMTFLSMAYLALQTAALVAAVGAFILVPQFALLGASIVFLAVGAYYWASNRPNLFKAMVSTCLHTSYYSIRNSITLWKLGRAKLELMEHTAQHINLLARQRLGEPIEIDVLAVFRSKHEELKEAVELLKVDAGHWKEMQDNIKAELLGAELADLNRSNAGRLLELQELILAIKSQFGNFSEEDKKELKEVLGLDLDGLNKNSSDMDFRERVLNSHLGISEDDLLEALKEQKMFEKRTAA